MLTASQCSVVVPRLLPLRPQPTSVAHCIMCQKFCADCSVQLSARQETLNGDVQFISRDIIYTVAKEVQSGAVLLDYYVVQEKQVSKDRSY